MGDSGPNLVGCWRSLEDLGPAPMGLTPFLDVATALAAALSDLHHTGSIYNDLKPGNILIDPVTLDIRLAESTLATRWRDQDHHPLSPIRGTLAYMSPEQTGRMNRAIDYRTDLYSLGVTLYQLLTGELPFRAGSALEWIACHLTRSPAPPAEKLPTLPGTVSNIVMRLLAKMAEDRYQSAHGLQVDLERCRRELLATGSVTPFPLGSQDVSVHFHLAPRLYGREAESSSLLTAFEHMIATGEPVLVLVTGTSGSGKSSLAQQLQKPVLQAGGWFLAGKFEPHRRDIPYAVTAARFEPVLQSILASPEAELEGWKSRLRQALGGQGGLLVEQLPGLEAILGPQPPVADLPPPEALHRCWQLWKRFLSALSGPDHPLVIFEDDLQWADAASLSMLEHVLDTPYLMMVGAYRTEDVGPDHMLSALGQTRSPLRVSVGPLNAADLRLLVADAVRCEPAAAESLASLVLDKTAGNPFFVKRFLRALSDAGLLWFDRPGQRWQWDLQQIAAANLTNDVVELMVGQIVRLTPGTREILAMAACLGHQFDLSLLARILDQPMVALKASLEPAILQGLLRLDRRPPGQPETLCWCHDRVQQAVLSLIPAEDQPALHLHIGQTWRGQQPVEQLGDSLFEVVRHFNAAAPLLASPEAQLDVARLNLEAGLRARHTAAFEAAAGYLAVSHSRLPADSWETHPDLCCSIYLERARCELIGGHVPTATELLAVLRQRAAAPAVQAETCRLEVELHYTLGRMELAIEVVRSGLARLFGLEVPLHPTSGALEEAVRRTLVDLEAMGDRDLLQLPRMQDATFQGKVALLSTALPAAYHSDPNLHCLLCCRIVSLSLRYGNTDFSPHGYVIFGGTLGRLLGRWEEAARLRKLALGLVEHPGLAHVRCAVDGTLAPFIEFWTSPFDMVSLTLERAIQGSREVGDLTHEVFAIQQTLVLQLASGHPLPQLVSGIDRLIQAASRSGEGRGQKTLGGLNDCVRDIQREVVLAETLDVPVETVSGSLKVHDFLRLTIRILIALLQGRVSRAVTEAEAADRLVGHSVGLPQQAEYFFYSALALADDFPHRTPEARQQTLDAIRVRWEQYRTWQNQSPANFAHRYLLIGAEIARLEGHDVVAMQRYEQAISAARGSHLVHMEALACERAARFHLDQGLQTAAVAYLRQALHCYTRWGATVAVRRLLEAHPALHEPDSASGMLTTAIDRRELDMAAAHQAAQACAGQLVVSVLRETLMRTVMEHAGAEFGVLFVRRGEVWWIAGCLGAPSTSAAPPPTLLRSTDERFPHAVLSYVLRTHERVLLAHAAQHPVFSRDPYMQLRQPKSVLCVPLLREGNLMGMLYLENNLATDVFTDDRVTMLEMLASQAVLALDSAEAAHLPDRREAEQERRAALILQSAQDGIISLGPDGHCSMVNPSALQMLHRTEADTVGHHIHDVLHNNRDHVSSTCPLARAKTARTECLDQFVRADASAFPVEYSLGPMDETAGVVVVFRDIGKVLEARHAQKMETIGQLAGGIAHDFNNVLTIITGYARLAQTGLAQSDDNYDMLREIALAADRGAALTAQLLTFGRRQVVQVESIDVNALVLQNQELLQRLIGVDLRIGLQLSGRSVFVHADRGQVEQILINLVVNARDAMPRGGRLLIATAVTTVAQPLATRPPVPAGDYVQISVQDTGTGMDEATQGHLFEPFFTTRPFGQGTGLGLSTVYGIVAQSRGGVIVDSHPGRGSTFHVYLPRIATHQLTQPNQPIASTRRTGGETILLVEDDAAVRGLLSRVLRKAGYQVMEAVDGEEGLQTMQREASQVGLLITDVVMPKLSGYALAEEVRRQYPSARVLLMSGYLDQEAARSGVQRPDVHFMSKPIMVPAFLDKVRQLLDQP